MGDFESDFKKILKEYHLKERTVPAKGYIAENSRFVPIKKQKSKLEQITTTATFLVFASGIFLLSSNITGSVIANLDKLKTNIYGAVLFVLGIFGLFLYFKKRKRMRDVYFY